MQIYQPESPRMCAPSTLMRPGIFGKRTSIVPDGPVPKYLTEMLRINKVAIKRDTFVPVVDWRDYLLDLKRTGTGKDILDCIQSKHERWERLHPPPARKPVEPPLDVSSDPLHVVVNLTITKTGKVKVTARAPMEHIYNEYISKGTKAPIDEYLKALKRFGYPESVLLNVLEKYQRREAESDELDTFIELVFGKGRGKTSKPKLRSVKERLTTRLKLKNIKQTVAEPPAPDVVVEK